ncbi:hypothetical protein [Limnochorda pilosa]|uniref:Glycosyl transferase n=1 Tax=Limnochorda pilosa TaxID=1555112 RepID=A0A0K2SMS4_LIMPI|nr:hypothetical protein [Limnochorda pilosa]BAS28410.1 hypothetical protein LIP_2580 [Limnochorda pilosa]
MAWPWLLAAAAAWAGSRLLGRAILGWSRERHLGVTNYRGRWVPLGLGVAWALAAAAALWAVGALVALPWSSPGAGALPGRAAAATGTGVALAAWILWAALVGWIDDLLGDGSSRGLRGHGRALAEGRLTTGALKVFLLGAGALLAAASGSWTGAAPGAFALLAGAVLLALTANAVNLLDVRPGRALKVALLLLAVAFVADPRSALPTLPGAAAALGILGWDLREEGVLGDAGANALGALAGWVAWRALPPGAWVLLLAALVGLHLYTERASLSERIEGSPLLRWLDRLGRLETGPEGEGGGASK